MLLKKLPFNRKSEIELCSLKSPTMSIRAPTVPRSGVVSFMAFGAVAQHNVYRVRFLCHHFPGYGVRWTADGREFRGFLEPQMVNGHEVGWRH